MKENASSGGKAWLSPSAEKSTLFVIPFLALPIAIYCFAVLPWYLGMIAAGSFTWATMTGVTKLLGKNANKKLVKTPFPTAIFQASACYVLFTWLFRLLPSGFLLTLSRVAMS